MKRLVTRNWFRSNPETGELDEFVKLAREHFSKDFLNPARQNCPSPSVLRSVVQSNDLPDQKLKNHLLTCSECFNGFQEELAKFRHAAAEDSTRKMLLINWKVAITGAVVAIVVLLPLILLMVNRQSQNREAGQTDPQSSPALPQPAASPTTYVSSTPAKSPAREKSRQQVVAHQTAIDLEMYNTLRNPRQAPERTVDLVRGQNQIAIRLAANSPKGRYRLDLTDAHGKPVRSTEANSDNGVQLNVTLDLTSVKPGRYFVCLTRKEEVPDCVPAEVR